MTTDDKVRIGIIGGSGLYDIDELTDCQEQEIDTPFGRPSAPYIVGTLQDFDERIINEISHYKE